MSPSSSRSLRLLQKRFVRVDVEPTPNPGHVQPILCPSRPIRPGVRRRAELFSFKDEPNLAESPKLKKHAMSVMNTVGVAVAGLADLASLVPVLQVSEP